MRGGLEEYGIIRFVVGACILGAGIYFHTLWGLLGVPPVVIAVADFYRFRFRRRAP